MTDKNKMTEINKMAEITFIAFISTHSYSLQPTLKKKYRFKKTKTKKKNSVSGQNFFQFSGISFDFEFFPRFTQKHLISDMHDEHQCD